MDNSSSIDSAWIPIGISIAVFVAFVGFIILGIFRFVQERRKRRAVDSRPRGHFVFAKIIDPVGPMERSAKYEKPLHEALHARGLGIVDGGGTQMNRDGSAIEWVGIDIDLANLEGALTFTCERLRELGAPPGSVLSYRMEGQKMTVQIA